MADDVKPKRLHYIDWLRVSVVLLLIPFHAALTYLRFGTVYIKAPVSGPDALPFLAVVVPFGDFVMTLLFFVSGVASFHSFKKRGGGMFVAERATKLMIPFLLGFLFLCPATAYMQALYEGFEGGFLSFIPQFFWYNIFHYHGYGHLWFLFYLFVFSMLCVPLFSRWQRDENRVGRIAGFLSRGHRLLLPIGAIVFLELCLRPFFYGDQTLIMDWANDAVYLSMLIFGYIFAADARIREKVREYFRPSIVFGLLSLAALFYVNIMWQVFYSSEIYLTPLWALAKGVYECSAIIFLLNLGSVRFNKGGRVIEYLSKSSFTVYIFHFFPVTFFTLLFIGLQAPIFVKFLLVVVLSYITVFLIYVIRQKAIALNKRIFLKRE